MCGSAPFDASSRRPASVVDRNSTACRAISRRLAPERGRLSSSSLFATPRPALDRLRQPTRRLAVRIVSGTRADVRLSPDESAREGRHTLSAFTVPRRPASGVGLDPCKPSRTTRIDLGRRDLHPVIHTRFPHRSNRRFPQISASPHDSGRRTHASVRRWAMPATESKKQIGRTRRGLGVRRVGAAGHAGPGAELALPARVRSTLSLRRLAIGRIDTGLLRGEVPQRAGFRSSARGDHVREDADAAAAGGGVDARASHEGIEPSGWTLSVLCLAPASEPSLTHVRAVG